MSDAETLYAEWRQLLKPGADEKLSAARKKLITSALARHPVAELIMLCKWVALSPGRAAAFLRTGGYIELKNILARGKLEGRIETARAWHSNGAPEAPKASVVADAVGAVYATWRMLLRPDAAERVSHERQELIKRHLDNRRIVADLMLIFHWVAKSNDYDPRYLRGEEKNAGRVRRCDLHGLIAPYCVDRYTESARAWDRQGRKASRVMITGFYPDGSFQPENPGLAQVREHDDPEAPSANPYAPGGHQ